VLSPDTRLPSVAVGGLPASKVRRVIGFIENNLHREPRLEELAAVTHMSPYHFARLFKRARVYRRIASWCAAGSTPPPLC